MIVVSDTGPLNYLTLIGHIGVLEVMYGSVIVPRAVADELSSPSAPPEVRMLIQSPPSWLSIANSPPAGPSLFDLGKGEQHAISLALSLHAQLLLCDDQDAREAAIRCGLKVVGTLGALNDAAGRGLLNFRDAIHLLRQTNFRISKKLVKRMLDSNS